MRALSLTALPVLLAATLLLGSDQLLSPSIASATNADVRISDGVTEQDAILVRESIRTAQDYFRDRLGLQSDQVIVVSVLNQADENDDETMAVASGTAVTVYTGSPGWQFGSPAERIATILHEYTHIYQYLVLGERDFESAAWFDEGFAEYVAIEALVDLGLLDQTSLFLYQVGLVQQFAGGLQLADLEDWEAFGEVGGDAYPLSFLAISNLLPDRSLADVQAMYEGIANGQSFAEAFESSYGLTPDAYYQEFDAGLATLQGSFDLPNDYAFNEGTDLDGPVTVVRAPDLSGADDQELVRAETLEGANCSLTLTPTNPGQETVIRDTFADGDGDVFWFVTIPADWQPGPAELTIECGGIPVVTTVEIGS